eukprot:CAMPEP_0170192456 /NCGR_PEP_ID=MMETSP0040_2-20121228/54264_1 /TAXON_ID=641309 /ORGANISM="Lotharella oceanica, Strain CCMP622" /LENGTH=247 /DNA_ID=CAMNT_0010440841 /DNA_START=21 /DNA_END=764 /DNA_ORIENTATION=+
MRIMLNGMDVNPSSLYPLTVEQTARSLDMLPKEKVMAAMNDFSDVARKAVEEAKAKISMPTLTRTPSKKGTHKTPYRTPSRRRSLHTQKKPLHWIQFIDEKTQTAYYKNETTGETTWERPQSQIQIEEEDFLKWEEEDEFTEEEFYAATQRAFDMVDKYKDGTIDEEELKEFLAGANRIEEFDERKKIIPRIKDIHGFRAFWDDIIDNYGVNKCLELFKDEFGFSIIPEDETPVTTPRTTPGPTPTK